MLYTIQHVEKIRGFKALTQNEERIIEKLLNNVNEFSKVRGFIKTRKEVMIEEFSLDTLEELVATCVELKEAFGTNDADNHLRMIVKYQLELLFRDHVPLDMVKEFRLCIAQRVELHDGCMKSAMQELKRYFTCGECVPVSQSYKQACKELEEGKIIYIEPTTIAN
jgi:hypothetical protein